ncbi:hypothetical protein H4219_006005 [Mycoemilia scoparia]|uniref:alpha-1,2-Mannosidase n=1 Tax=Mycoemilia scoparia TaxID=417184 RepID=A0A9W7ZKC8_9FUNG|nr:hypothetical protein H4219_006005 [Mycoemilia scoparia]
MYRQVSQDTESTPRPGDDDMFNDHTSIEKQKYHHGWTKKRIAKYVSAAFVSILALYVAFTLIVVQPGSYFNKTDKLNSGRREAVRNAMKYAWDGYRQYAFDSDELLPLSGGGSNEWGGWKLTLLDSLDTLYIMELHDEFDEAKKQVADIDFTKSQSGPYTSFFEMTIRAVAGLLSAYEMSGDKLLLEKAQSVADVLFTAFDPKTQLPHRFFDVNNRVVNPSSPATIADAGSCILEYAKLSQFTGNSTYFEKAKYVYDYIINAKTTIPGLYPSKLNASTGALYGPISFGAYADSFYEYMVKYYLLNDRKDDQYVAAYNRSIESMKTHMVGQSKVDSSLSYVGAMYYNDNSGQYVLDGEYQHLTCFVPGMLALGHKTLNRPQDLELAKKLMKTCYTMYSSTRTGLAAESIWFAPVSENKTAKAIAEEYALSLNDYDAKHGFFRFYNSYVLRPEVVESLMLLYRITGDPIYQEWGWNIFSAIEEYTKTSIGYATYKDVMDKNAAKNWVDQMSSFFLAETLKYLYLLFSPNDVISLDEYVFNTEAHPFRIIK